MTNDVKKKIGQILEEGLLPSFKPKDPEDVWYDKIEPKIDDVFTITRNAFVKQAKWHQRAFAKVRGKSDAATDWTIADEEFRRRSVKLATSLITCWKNDVADQFRKQLLDRDAFKTAKNILKEVVLFGRSNPEALETMLEKVEGNFHLLLGMMRRYYRKSVN